MVSKTLMLPTLGVAKKKFWREIVVMMMTIRRLTFATTGRKRQAQLTTYDRGR